MSETSDIEDALIQGGKDGLQVAAELVKEQAIRNMPIGDPAVDPDPAVALAASVNIEQHGLGVIISVDTVYAAKQHEDLRLKHPRSGGPKYLERALTELAPQLEGITASSVKARLASGLHR